MSITRAATILLACTSARAVSIGEHDALTPPAEQLLAEIEASKGATTLDNAISSVKYDINTLKS